LIFTSFQHDTQRQLDWLKTVKQTHGSVEVTSLAQAEAINTNGIYQVGNLKKSAAIKNPVRKKTNNSFHIFLKTFCFDFLNIIFL
jgi:hypothetical protein